MLSKIQEWKRYWKITTSDGSEYSQFDPATGKKLEWDLKWDVVKAVLMPFDNDLANLVQKTGIAAVATGLNPISVTGSAVLALRDTLYVQKRFAICPACRITFEWEKDNDPVCPQCGAKNGWSCAEHGPFLLEETPKNDKGVPLCPICKDNGHTTGLAKKKLIEWGQTMLYDTHYVMRFNCKDVDQIEIRETDEEVIIHGNRTENAGNVSSNTGNPEDSASRGDVSQA